MELRARMADLTTSDLKIISDFNLWGSEILS